MISDSTHSASCIPFLSNTYKIAGDCLWTVGFTGEELNFILSGDDTHDASRVWFGSFDDVSQSFEERMNCILKYCMEREICESDRTTIVSVIHFCSYIRIIYKYLELMCINLLIIDWLLIIDMDCHNRMDMKICGRKPPQPVLGCPSNIHLKRFKKQCKS
jgi:hypothetical protein